MEKINNEQEKLGMNELRESQRQCWSPPCKRIAWFEDWGGWHWCWRHMLREILLSDNAWFEIRKMRLRNPYKRKRKSALENEVKELREEIATTERMYENLRGEYQVKERMNLECTRQRDETITELRAENERLRESCGVGEFVRTTDPQHFADIINENPELETQPWRVIKNLIAIQGEQARNLQKLEQENAALKADIKRILPHVFLPFAEDDPPELNAIYYRLKKETECQ